MGAAWPATRCASGWTSSTSLLQMGTQDINQSLCNYSSIYIPSHTISNTQVYHSRRGSKRGISGAPGARSIVLIRQRRSHKCCCIIHTTNSNNNSWVGVHTTALPCDIPLDLLRTWGGPSSSLQSLVFKAKVSTFFAEFFFFLKTTDDPVLGIINLLIIEV